MGVLDKYLRTPATKLTTTKNIYDTAVSIQKEEEKQKALQNMQAELERNTALFPKKPLENVNNTNDSEYIKVRTELGLDLLDAKLEKQIADRLAEGKGIAEYRENLARVEMTPEYEKIRSQLEANESQLITRLGKDKYIELYNEIDSKTVKGKKTNTKADLEYGKLQVESSLAWDEYLKSGLYLDKAKAISKDEELDRYYKEHYKELGNSILSGTAEHLPQELYQLKHNTPAFVAGGLTLGATTAITKNPKIGLKAGQTVSAIGSAITSSTASYDLIRGGVFRDLIKLGVDENVAKEISADSAFWQSLIEGGETFFSIFSLFKNPASSGVKQKIKDYLKAYGVNIITEGLEEGSQEMVGIAYEKKALEESGLDTSGYDFWNNVARIGEATKGGMEIAITLGGARTGLIMSADSISKVKTKNDIKKNIDSYYDSEIEKNKGNAEKIAELEQAKAEATNDKNLTEIFNFVMSEEGQRMIKEQQDSAKKVQTRYKNQNADQQFLSSEQERLKTLTDPNLELKVENNISQMHANAKTQVERITKGEYEVVYYTANNLEATLELNEIINENAGKKIFVNANMNAKDTYAVIGHGLGHFIISKNPNILTEFENKITPEQLKTYNETLGYQLDSDGAVLEELFVDYIGELFSREDVVKRFEKQTMTTGEKIADVGKNFIANTTGIDTRSSVSSYNMSQTSRLHGDIIHDRDFENEILNILSESGRPTNPQINPQVKDKVGTIQKDQMVQKQIVNQNLSDLQMKYDSMKRDGKKQLEIKKMIAKELGIEKYDSLKRNPTVDDKYRELSNNYEERMMYANDEIDSKGTKFSKKVDKNKALAIEMNAKRAGRKPLNKKLDSAKDKIAQGEYRLAEEKAKTKRVRKEGKDKAIAVEMNAKRTVMKSLNKKLDTEKDRTAKVEYKLKEEKVKNEIEKKAVEINAKQTARKDLVNKLDNINIKKEAEKQAKKTAKKLTDSKKMQKKIVPKIKNETLKNIKKQKTVDKRYQYLRSEHEISSDVKKTLLKEEEKKIMDSIRKKLKYLFSPKLYNKLSNELKVKVDEFEGIYTGGNTKKPTTWIKEMVKLVSEEMAEKPDIIVSDKVLKAIENPEKITLASYGTLEDLQYLESLIDDLINDIADMFIFRGANIDLETTKQEFTSEIANLAIPAIQKEDMIAYRRSIREAKLTGKLINGLENMKNGVEKTSSKYVETMSTFHTLLLTMAKGNPESALFILEKFLQEGDMREKQAELEMMEALAPLREKNIFGNEKFNKDLMKMLDRKAEWIDVGIQYEDSNGYTRTLQLPKSMILSLAMHLKNNDNLKHITGQLVEIRSNKDGAIEIISREGGGIIVPNKQYYQNGDMGRAYAHGKKLKLNVEEVEQIVSKLTDEELAFLDVVEEFYKVSTNLINRTSNKLLGYDLATVANYFPIRVSLESLNRSRELEEKKGLVSAQELLLAFDIVNNFGFLKERNHNSFEPILLENIAEVMTRSLDGVSKYYGYAIALYDNNLLLNAKLREPIKVGSVEYNNVQELISKINPNFKTFYNKMTTFIIGAQNTRMSAIESKIRTLHAHATFQLNLGSWLKNFGALFSTLKYHTVSESIQSALPNNSKVKVDNKVREYYEGIGTDTSNTSKRELFRSFIAQATPELDWRRLGYRMPEARDLYKHKNVFARMNFVQGMSMVENLSITAIARMETFILSLDDSLEFGSDKFIKRLGERINEVIAQTQQVNSQINKADIARNPTNIISKALTFYSSDSMQLFNVVIDSALELRYAKQTKDKAKFKKAWFKMNKTAIGLVLNFATIEMISRTIQGHDDDDELFDEDFLISMLINMLSPTLFLDDIVLGLMSLIDSESFYSYDITLPELDFINSIIDLTSKIGAIMSGTTDEHRKPKAWVDVIKDLGTITGIPTRDLLKWYVGLLKYADNDAYKQYSLYITPNAYKKWLENTDMEKAELYDVYQATREKSLKEKFGYVEKSDKESEQLKQATRRAIESVTKDSEKVSRYMYIFGGYKS